MHMNKWKFEERNQQRRVKEGFTKVLQDRVRRDNVLAANFSCDNNVDVKRRHRRINERQKEMTVLDSMEREEREKREREARRRQDEELAALVQKQRITKQEYETKVRRICAESEELRELEQKLKAAYVNKERAAQLEEEKLRVQMEANEQARLDKIMEQDLAKKFERARIEEEDARRKAECTKASLAEQLKLRVQQRQAEQEKSIKEKEQVDAIVRQIEVEDRRTEERFRQKQVETKKYVDQYLLDRQRWKHEEKARSLAEQDKIQEFQQSQDARAVTEKKRRDEKLALEAAAYERVRAKIEREKHEREEQEALLDELYRREADLRVAEIEKKAHEDKERMRRVLSEENRKQTLLKARSRVKEQQEEETVRQMMLEKFRLDDERERERARLVEIRRKQHRLEMDQIVEKRMRALERDQRSVMEEREREEAESRIRAEIVENERRRLLREHAARLKEFLPKAVLKHESDKELVFGAQR